LGDGTDERRDRFTLDEWAGISSFPFLQPGHPCWTEATVAGTAQR
jgi:hypothetical protein